MLMYRRFLSAIYEKVFYIVLITFILVTIFLTQLRLSNIEARRKFLRDYDDYNDNITYEEYVEEKLKQMKLKVESIMFKKKMIKYFNAKQIVYNKEFIPKNNGYVIVVQVNENVRMFKELIQSLKNVIGINKCLFIFSHGSYDSDINKIVMNITFAKFMQIYYPYSYLLYPGTFPGNDKKYCTDGYSCEQSNGERKPHLSHKKNHWWWQMNHVFDQLHELRSFSDYIVFLEENQLVAADLIYMLTIMQRLMWDNPDFDMISFGAYAPDISRYHLKNAFASIRKWTLSISSIGIAFNRTVWNFFKGMKNDFCNFNDYRWTNSLLQAVNKTSKKHMNLFASEGPRVFEVREDCDTAINESCKEMELQRVKLFLKSIKRGLFPLSLQEIQARDDERNIIEEGGGFGDIRDRELCKLFSKETNIFTS